MLRAAVNRLRFALSCCLQKLSGSFVARTVVLHDAGLIQEARAAIVQASDLRNEATALTLMRANLASAGLLNRAVQLPGKQTKFCICTALVQRATVA